MAELNLEQALDVACDAVRAAARVALPYFQANVAVKTKSDQSPVTEADLNSEKAILDTIRATFPSHTILTEESGELAGEAESRWIVDPLDGTRGFIRGGSFWGPIVALEHRGEIVAGALAMPVLGETYWAARGLGAWRDGARLKLSPTDQWSGITLSLGEVQRIFQTAPRRAIEELILGSASVRALGDVASIAMLLNGRADFWIEGGVRIWDIAASKILVEEAGGLFTDFEGRATPASGCALAGNPALHRHVLSVLKRAREET